MTLSNLEMLDSRDASREARRRATFCAGVSVRVALDDGCGELGGREEDATGFLPKFVGEEEGVNVAEDEGEAFVGGRGDAEGRVAVNRVAS